MKLTLEKAQKIIEKSNGNLDLKWMHVESLPDNLIVPGDLNADNCQIRNLPKGLVVCGNLNLSRTLVESVPCDLIVGRNVSLNSTPLSKLPAGFIVPGYLDISFTPIQKLPNDLVVGRSLYMGNTKVDSLPKGMVVADCLDLRKTWVTALPDDLIVNGRVYSDRVKFGRFEDKHLCNGDYVPGKYLYANDVLTQIDFCYQEADYIVYVGKIRGCNVVSDGVQYVQCSDVREGLTRLSLESKSSLNEAMTMYGVITSTGKQEMKNLFPITKIQNKNTL